MVIPAFQKTQSETLKNLSTSLTNSHKSNNPIFYLCTKQKNDHQIRQWFLEYPDKTQ